MLPFLNEIVCMDALDLLRALPDKSIDMILCDLPYGAEKTKLKWDNRLDTISLWKELKRVVMRDSAIVLTAAQPFSSLLIHSNLEMFRYQWYWHKPRGANFGASKNQPLRVVEDILVFSHLRANSNQFVSETMRYFPIKEKLEKSFSRVDKPHHRKIQSPSLSSHVHNPKVMTRRYEEKTPTNLLYFAMDSDKDRGLHSTQKPVALFEYLIKTYTLEGQLVVDMCVGSGTTALAARNLGRNFICGDLSPEYVAMANLRLQNSDPFQDSTLKTGEKQLSLFRGMG